MSAPNRPSLTKPLIYTNILFIFSPFSSKYKSSSFISLLSFLPFYFFLLSFLRFVSLSIPPCFFFCSLPSILPSILLVSSLYYSLFLFLLSCFFSVSSCFLSVPYSLLLILFSILLVSSLFPLYFPLPEL